jgi:hypothetical protein
MKIGRFFCVALPFILLLGSIICLLIVALAGVTNKDMYMFSIDVQDLSLDPLDKEIKNKLGLDFDGIDLKNIDTDSVLDKLGIDLGFLNNKNSRRDDDSSSSNITAKTLGLTKKEYEISVWGYCGRGWDDKRTCTQPKWNWAAEISDAGKSKNVTLPNEIKSAVSVFKQATKWTQYAFVFAFVALVLEMVVGIFSGCSRIVSCIVWIISGVATLLVLACLGVTAGTALAVVGAVKGTAEIYGAKASLHDIFFIILAFSAAFALAASLFWIFTVCCCKPGHRDKRKNRKSDSEKLLGGSNGKYAPIGSDHEMTSGGFYNHNQSSSQYGAPRYPSGAARSDLAYEPYSHRA